MKLISGSAKLVFDPLGDVNSAMTTVSRLTPDDLEDFEDHG